MENGIGKIQLKFLRQIVRKDGLENVTLSGHIDGGREVGRQSKAANNLTNELVKMVVRTGIRGYSKTINSKSYKRTGSYGEPCSPTTLKDTAYRRII